MTTNTQAFAAEYLRELSELIEKFDTDRFEQILEQIMDAYLNEHHIFIMGNGGSGSTASHFACDINKGCCFDLDKKFKVICLNDNIPTMLALANDVDYESVFVEQMKNFFQKGDLVIGISGSGNSENVLRAVRYANTHDGKTIGFSGYAGGELAKCVDIPFVAAIDDMQKVEDLHMIIVHMLTQAIDHRLHPE